MGIAFGAQPVGFDLRALAPFVQLREGLHVEPEAAPRQIGRDFGRSAAQQFGIDHLVFLSVFLAVSSCVRRRCIASAMRISKPRWTGK